MKKRTFARKLRARRRSKQTVFKMIADAIKAHVALTEAKHQLRKLKADAERKREAALRAIGGRR